MARSVIGWHYSIGGQKDGIGAFIDKLKQANIPLLLKGVDDAGLCYEAQNKGIKQHLICRVSTAGQPDNVQYDVPDYTKSPKAAAQEHFDKTAVKWPGELLKSVVWMEPINEPRAKLNPGDVQYGNMHPVDWLGWFMVEYAVIANGQGFKVCGPSFNSGEPEVFTVNDYEQEGMLAYLQYCAANPDKAALSVHEYTWTKWLDGESWPDWYPQLFGRVEAAIAAADRHGIPRTFSIFMTEWGFGQHDAPRWPECEPYLTDYNEWAAKWPQVKGVASWTLQSGWGGVDHDIQSWIGPLGNYAVSKDFPAGPQPAKTHPLFGGTLPNGDNTPMPTLNETLWNASHAEWAAQRVLPGYIQYPLVLGSWQEQMRNVKRVPAHNEKSLVFDTVTYSYQGFFDPYGELPYVVQAWSSKSGHFVVKEPAGGAVPPDPFLDTIVQ